MFRTTVLSTAALLGLAVLAPTTASAAGETCQGQPATMVGGFGQELTGTPGADVVVTNGSTIVNTGGGDDLVCVTGSPPRGNLRLDTGAGDDSVEVLAPDWATSTRLGDGADTFVATNGFQHTVYGGSDADLDLQADDIRIAAGRATVVTGRQGQPNADVVEIADGTVVWRGLQAAPGRVTAPGPDQLVLETADPHARLDTRAGTMVASDTALTFSGFTSFTVQAHARQGRFWFHGSQRDESLFLLAPKNLDRYVALGGGDDRYSSDSLGGSDSRIRGSGGTDSITLSLPKHKVVAKLGPSTFTAGSGKNKTVLRAGSFEDVTLGAKRADVTGTRRADVILVAACHVDVRAGKGPDRVYVEDEIDDELSPPRCKSRRAVLHGGRGHDELYGDRGNDKLVGGPGKDLVDGDQGRDACQGETRRRCEIRIR